MTMDDDRKIFIEAIANFPRETEELIHLNVKRIIKNTEVSQETRNQGNKLFIKKEHDENDHENILRFYNQSLCLAPDGSEELAYAYGNRSALFLHMKLYESSIQDIDKAMKITNLDNFKVKLLCRKVECLAFLDLLEAGRTLQQAKDALISGVPENSREILNNLISKTESFLKTIIQNPIVISRDNYKKEMLMSLNKREKQNFNKTVMIKHNKKYGNHLVASRDIHPGEIIIVEKFYASCLNLNKTFTSCHHCLHVCWSGIPCNDCAWAMFCSEECKSKALESYHDIECYLIPYVRMFGEDLVYNNHICIRVLIKAIKEAGSISKLRAQLKAIDKTNTEELLKNIHLDKKFSTIYTLLKSDIVLDESFFYSYVARVVMIFLAKYTSFFGENFIFNKVRDLMENEDFLFVGSLFTKIFKMRQINWFAIQSARQTKKCNHSVDNFMHEQKLCCSRGSGLTILCSFINHSCDPNVRRCFTDDNRIIIFATQNIKKNSQIFDCYGQLYFEAPKIERNKLLNNYGFTCDCKACKGNWPAFYTDVEVENYCRVNYLKNLQTGLGLEIQKIEDKLMNPDYKCDWKTVQELLKIVTKASKNLSEPSMTICLLYSHLHLAFEKMYSLDEDVFGQCKV